MIRKNHVIPAFILRYFKNPGSDRKGPQVSYLILESREVEDNYISDRNDYYNIKNFYSTEPLSSIVNPDLVEINNLFKRKDFDLEKNLSIVESKASPIIRKVVNNIDVKLTQKEIAYLKEYFVIQNLRTRNLKEAFKKFKIKFPDYFKEKLSEKVRNPESIKEFIKKNYPDMNAKKRRELCKQFLKSKKIQKAIEKENQKARDCFNEVFKSDKSHSIYIINKEIRDIFFKETRLDSLNLNILINNTSEEFLLTDAGVLMDENKQEYILPITPKICIAFTNITKKKRNLDVDEVRKFNRSSRDTSMSVLFGTRKQLELFEK